jgi:hypothetical protein
MHTPDCTHHLQLGLNKQAEQLVAVAHTSSTTFTGGSNRVR